MSAKLAGARSSLAFRGHCGAQAVPVRSNRICKNSVRAAVDSHFTGSARVVEFFIFYFLISTNSFIACLQHGESTISAGAGVLYELYITQLDIFSLKMLQELNDLVDKKLFTQVSQRSNAVTLKKMRDVTERSKAYHEEKDNV